MIEQSIRIWQKFELIARKRNFLLEITIGYNL